MVNEDIRALVEAQMLKNIQNKIYANLREAIMKYVSSIEINIKDELNKVATIDEENFLSIASTNLEILKLAKENGGIVEPVKTENIEKAYENYMECMKQRNNIGNPNDYYYYEYGEKAQRYYAIVERFDNEKKAFDEAMNKCTPKIQEYVLPTVEYVPFSYGETYKKITKGVVENDVK